ncbi:leucine/isoleucine/valine transporter permease subunit [Serratia odorifera]|uniref:Leucine/isoleucine/valine transporter permease subunit n=1 Tax=Serratia odorifera TaxID=618 RepID=A0A3S4DXV7_SEROD|nr:leucine/isoleucine/valine transporter permease subunit [Serratia odorifera]
MQQGLGKMSGPSWVLPSFDGTTLRQKLLAALLIIAAVAWPFFVSRGTVDIATLTLIYVMLGLGLNVVVGLSGLLVLGYGGFYAIGAYTYALLNHYYGLGFWESLPLAGIVTAAFGFLLGFPVLRLRGDYLAIVTLGFGEIVRILLLNNTDITGGQTASARSPNPRCSGWNSAAARAMAAGTPSTISLGCNTIRAIASSSCIWWRCCWWY